MKCRRGVHYVARPKVKGVPHHAKAGNINSALLLEAPTRGDFVLVLDCDMLCSSDMLVASVGHFYEQRGNVVDSSAAATSFSKRDDVESGGRSDSSNLGAHTLWTRKPKMAFLQLPQDFYNLSPKDPLAHGGRLFYGPQQQGRDGAGAVCVCGTGVFFARDALVSIGGFAYGSITEDNLTSQVLAAAGFSGAYLDRRLVYGLAPENVPDTLEQKQRWVMGALQVCVVVCMPVPLMEQSRMHALFCLSVGTLAYKRGQQAWRPCKAGCRHSLCHACLSAACLALPCPVLPALLQILFRRNPIAQPGLTWTQRMLYFESVAYALCAPITALLQLVPLVFMFSLTSPLHVPRLWELCVAFGLFFIAMELLVRILWWLQHGSVIDDCSTLALQRPSYASAGFLLSANLCSCLLQPSAVMLCRPTAPTHRWHRRTAAPLVARVNTGAAHRQCNGSATTSSCPSGRSLCLRAPSFAGHCAVARWASRLPPRMAMLMTVHGRCAVKGGAADTCGV
jgi:cellulose synthase/poly-beta-1,6-N-acetylglucosamine synthase-like glycosyltransferase